MKNKFLAISYSYFFKHAMSVSITVFVAMLINHFFSFSHGYWMVLAAFLMGQTTPGTQLKQNLIFFIIILAAILLSSFVSPSIIIFASHASIHDKLLDAIIGVLIGALCAKIIFPLNKVLLFHRELVPILAALNSYIDEMIKCFLQPELNLSELSKKRINIETIQLSKTQYPEWVYEVGFNPGLRAGFRFFLITLERVIETLMAMEHQLRVGIAPDMREAICNSFQESMRQNQVLLTSLQEYFANDKQPQAKEDFTSDIAQFENDLQKIVPTNLELLDIYPDYIALVAFVRGIKDLRTMLLQLILALPTQAPK